jgi:hypothetical protein
MTLVQIAEHYVKFHNKDCLKELERRDRLAKMGFDECMALRLKEEEPDNQLFLEFASSEDHADTSSVKGPLEEAYEAGWQAGHKVGLKEGKQRHENN